MRYIFQESSLLGKDISYDTGGSYRTWTYDYSPRRQIRTKVFATFKYFCTLNQIRPATLIFGQRLNRVTKLFRSIFVVKATGTPTSLPASPHRTTDHSLWQMVFRQLFLTMIESDRQLTSHCSSVTKLRRQLRLSN